VLTADRINLIQTTYCAAIARATNDFGDHEGMGSPRITRWIAHFEDADHPLAIKILREIKYYRSENIRAMVRSLVQLSCIHFRAVDPNRILFIPIGEPFEGSSVIARALRDELQGEERIKRLSDLERLTQGTFDAIVFLDDFSGTGSQLEEWWENVEPIVLPRNVPFAIALLVMNHRARRKIEQFTNVLCVDELDVSHNILSPLSGKFTQIEKDKITEYCRRTGCEKAYLQGFGRCGLLLAFKHQCPDNSLPILWYDEGDTSWEPLFRRYGL
jgi:hypothetical protein